MRNETPWLRRLALALPREVRVRVFEPALEDLRADQIEQHDPEATVGLGLVAMLACAGPARRAARTDPIVALRAD